VTVLSGGDRSTGQDLAAGEESAATARMRRAIAHLRPEGVDALHLRPVVDDDAAELIELVHAAYDEFRCGPLDPDGFDADLTRPAGHAQATARRWWIVRSALAAGANGAHGVLVASIAHGPLQVDGTVELHRLYLDRRVRGRGLASALIAGVRTEAHHRGATRLHAWSDSRLTAAHARYLALGFECLPTQRRLDDPAETTEHCFELRLDTGLD